MSVDLLNNAARVPGLASGDRPQPVLAVLAATHGSRGSGSLWHRIGIYGENMAHRDYGPDRRPACSARAADQIYVRGRIRRGVVRAGFCREPGKALRLCEFHLAQLRRVVPQGGVWVVGRYQRDGSEAAEPDPLLD